MWPPSLLLEDWWLCPSEPGRGNPLQVRRVSVPAQPPSRRLAVGHDRVPREAKQRHWELARARNVWQGRVPRSPTSCDRPRDQ